MNTPHEGLLLLGGRALRFGSDKMTARIDGVPLYHNVYMALAQVCRHINLSVGSTSDHLHPTGLPQQNGCSWVVIADRTSDQGPLGGIASALAERTCDMLVVAGDLPRMSADPLLSILEAGRHSKASIIGARSRLSRKEQPLCGLWKHGVAARLNSYLDAGQRSVFGFLESQDVHWVDVDDDLLVNINRPEDLDLLT